MASGLFSVVMALALYVVLTPSVSAGDKDCQAYRDQPSQKCKSGFCCGTCFNRYCCQDTFWRFSEEKQDDCDYSFKPYSSPLPMILGIGGFITVLLIFICCCVCPCCCLYKVCRSPRPVLATTHHTTVVTTAPQQYPQQPTAAPGHPQSYQGGQYHPYHPVPVQPGYGAQPMPQGYGAQPMPQGYGAQPMPQGYGAQPMPQGYGAQPMPTSPCHGQQVTAGPPPTYQEATGPGFPPSVMPYSQAAFTPGQPAYPLQPPAQPQPNAPVPYKDYLAQPAYNPDYTG